MFTLCFHGATLQIFWWKSMLPPTHNVKQQKQVWLHSGKGGCSHAYTTHSRWTIPISLDLGTGLSFNSGNIYWVSTAAGLCGELAFRAGCTLLSEQQGERGPLLCISIIYKKNESLFNYLFFLIHALCPQWLWIREIKILKAKLLTSLLLSGRFKCHCSLESI